jgi:hypothetical protein
MSAAHLLLAELAQHGIRVEALGDRLRLRGSSALPPDLRERVLQAKPELLAYFRTQHAEAPHGGEPHVRRCRRCGYYVFDAERIFCARCDEELPQPPQPPPASSEAEGERSARAQQEAAEIDRLASADGWKSEPATDTALNLPPASSPAYGLLDICRGHGVALRIDEFGDVVVGKAGARVDEDSLPWPDLITELEAHLEDVARLVEAGWLLKARPRETSAA